MSEMNEVRKSGETWLEITFQRRVGGLEVWVRAKPEVETFIKSLSSYPTNPLTEFGNSWSSLKDHPPLNVYSMNYDPLVQGNGSAYYLGAVGYPLLSEGRNGYGSSVNLSFLQFVGIGTPDGVRFMLNGPYPKDLIKSTSSQIISTATQLIRDFIVPVHISLRATSQEL